MTINPPTVAVGPTITRADTRAVAIKIVNAVPPLPHKYIELAPSGLVYYLREIPQPADIEGRIVAYRDGLDEFVQLYVVVNTGSLLEWRPVIGADLINSFTGKPYDPLAAYYDPLAS